MNLSLRNIWPSFVPMPKKEVPDFDWWEVMHATYTLDRDERKVHIRFQGQRSPPFTWEAVEVLFSKHGASVYHHRYEALFREKEFILGLAVALNDYGISEAVVLDTQPTNHAATQKKPQIQVPYFL